MRAENVEETAPIGPEIPPQTEGGEAQIQQQQDGQNKFVLTHDYIQQSENLFFVCC